MEFYPVKLKYQQNAEVFFCELCYKSYKAKEMCDYCYQVYFTKSDDGEVDGKMWISCDGKNCNKWNHPDCEILYGEDETQQNAASKLKQE